MSIASFNTVVGRFRFTNLFPNEKAFFVDTLWDTCTDAVSLQHQSMEPCNTVHDQMSTITTIYIL